MFPYPGFHREKRRDCRLLVAVSKAFHLTAGSASFEPMHVAHEPGRPIVEAKRGTVHA
jgi:hypothetical protein